MQNGFSRASLAVQRRVQERVAKLSLWIVHREQALEFLTALVATLQHRAGNRAQLGDHQVRTHVIVEPLDREYGLDGIRARDEILRLQFLSAAGREPHAE